MPIHARKPPTIVVRPPPPRHRQLQPLVSAVSPPGSTYGYGETTEGQEGKEKLVTVSVQACAK